MSSFTISSYVKLGDLLSIAGTSIQVEVISEHFAFDPKAEGFFPRPKFISAKVNGRDIETADLAPVIAWFESDAGQDQVSAEASDQDPLGQQ